MLLTSFHVTLSQVLHRTCSPHEAELAMAELQAQCGETEMNDQTTSSKSCACFVGSNRATQKLLLAGIGTAFWQQATGVEAIIYYTPEVLGSFGITGKPKLLATMLVGLVKVMNSKP